MMSAMGWSAGQGLGAGGGGAVTPVGAAAPGGAGLGFDKAGLGAADPAAPSSQVTHPSTELARGAGRQPGFSL